jgi:hypothetical protein
MEKQRASQIIEFAFLNADGHIRSEDMFEYDVKELTDALRMALFALRQNENQHVYIFKDEEVGDIICDLWTTSVPDIGEQMILWNNGEHHHYEVTRRIYGANAEEKVGVWNLYVKQKRKGFID